MRIITGYTGEAHVTSDDMSALQRGIIGHDDYFIRNGFDIKATAVAGDVIQLSKSEIVIQGTHCRISAGEQVEIEPGTSGKKRTDYIIARYTKDGDGIEAVELAVKKGTAYTTTEVLPELTQDSIRNGGTTREVALYKVTLNGSLIQTIEKVLPTINTMKQMQTDLDESQNSISTNAANIKSLDSTNKTNNSKIKTIQDDIKKLKEKLDFDGKIRAMSKYARATISSYVSTYDKSGDPSVLAAKMAVQNKKDKEKASLRLYSNGRLSLYKGDDGHSIPVIKRFKVSLTPKKTGDAVTKNITYGVTFDEAPVVVCSAITENPHTVHCSITNNTTKGCTVNLVREKSTTETTVHVIVAGLL